MPRKDTPKPNGETALQSTPEKQRSQLRQAGEAGREGRRKEKKPLHGRNP